MHTRIAPFAILFVSTAGISPVIIGLVPGTAQAIALFLLIAVIYKIRILNNTISLFIAFASLFSGTYLSYIWGDPIYMAPFFFVASSAIISGNISYKDLALYVEQATNFLLISEILCLIGLFYFLLGGPNIALIDQGGDGSRDLYLYATTFTLAPKNGFIRPSFIFDEPGTYSFIICSIAILRYSLGMDTKVTDRLIIFGLITFSLFQLIFTLLYLLNKRSIGALYAASLSLIIILTFSVPDKYIPDIIKIHFLERIQIDSDRSFSGNNRSPLIDNSLDILSTFSNKEKIGGRGPFCIKFPNDFPCFVPGDEIGANPLQPLVSYGAVGSWPYTISLLWPILLIVLFRVDYFVAASFLLMILQRPFTMSFGYSLLIFLILFNISRWNKSRKMVINPS